MSVVVGAGAITALMLVALTVVIWKLWSVTRVRGVDPEWLREFSLASYRPMERLLNPEDAEFLKSQPGYEPGMEADLYAERRRIFRLYLKNIGRDFNRLHYALRLLLLHSPEDNPELAKTLIRQKVVFFAALLAVHSRLTLHQFGIGTVDASGLVRAVEAAQAQVEAFLATPTLASSSAS